MAGKRTRGGLTIGAVGLCCIILATLGEIILRGQPRSPAEYVERLLVGVIRAILVLFASVLLWVSWLDWKRGERAQAG